MIVQITESQLKHLLSKKLDEHYGIRYIEQWGENELLLPLFHHLYGLENLGGPLSSLTPEESVEKVSQIIGGSKHTFMVLTNNFRKFTVILNSSIFNLCNTYLNISELDNGVCNLFFGIFIYFFLLQW